jgi:cobalt/nickel transport system ATP-binding protein
MAYIDLDKVAYQFPDGTLALDNVSFSIDRGEKVAVLGDNGSGKSTLFLLLSGLIKACRGTYRFDGRKLKNSHVGLTFQNPEVQLFAPTVYQEISFGPVNLGLKREEVETRIYSAMSRTGIESLKDRPVQYLSYGQKKKVAIADILAMETDVFILDEPFAWMDRKGTIEMKGILEELSHLEKTVILATHKSDFAWSWADKVILFKEGKVLGCGSTEDIFLNDSLLDEVGIDQPSVVKMAKSLNYSGVIPKTMDELIEFITLKDSLVYER